MIRCKRCGQELVSMHKHDFKKCKCPNGTFIDGGDDYLRIGGTDIDNIELGDKHNNKWVEISKN